MKRRRPPGKGLTAEPAAVGAPPAAGSSGSTPAASAGAHTIIGFAEALQLLQTTPATLYRWLRSGRLKGMKVGRQWRFYRSDVQRFLEGQEPRVEIAADPGPLLAQLRERLAQCGGAPEGFAPEAPPDLQAVRLMISLGYYLRASDIHLGPNHVQAPPGTTAVLRCRIDGVLHVVAELDVRLLRPLVERWKSMADCNVREAMRPQDGRVLVTVGGKQLDLRICFLPALTGESVTIRILDAGTQLLTLEQVPYTPRDHQLLHRALHAPWGLVVITGPTGSGKTTTLYACLNHLATPANKVMSIENPVEYVLPWVTQIQVNPGQGLTFATGLRAVLRSDPDVILVGEIRDLETLNVAMQSSLTGHLVLTTLHADEAARGLKRLVEIGTEPFVVADATKLVVAQRLVRKLCVKCRAEAAVEGLVAKKAAAAARAGGVDWEALPKAFRKPVGCSDCRQTGYRGRVPIAEALEVTPEIAAALRRGATVDELRAVAVADGMTTMAADGIRRAAAGVTSLSEVFGVWGLQ